MRVGLSIEKWNRTPRMIQRTPQFPMIEIKRMMENTAVHIMEEAGHGSGMELLHWKVTEINISFKINLTQEMSCRLYCILDLRS